MDFTGKTVVITGASSGIGWALAKEFSKLHANVVVGARNAEKLKELTRELTTPSAYLATDVTHEDDCKSLIECAITEFGQIDILICNAGISMRALYDDVDMSVIHQLMDVNFWGTAYCVKYALPYIQKTQGSIVAISSVAGFHGLPGRTGYSASKYAIQGLLDTIRVENLKKNVHVMVVAPGFTSSNVRFSALTAHGTPQGETPRDESKMMTAEEVAHRIAKGVMKRKRTILMDFDGKATVFLKKISPRLVDILFYKHMAKELNSPLNH